LFWILKVSILTQTAVEKKRIFTRSILFILSNVFLFGCRELKQEDWTG
jgi:hypothetical protein